MGQRPARPSARSGARIGNSSRTPDAIDIGIRMCACKRRGTPDHRVHCSVSSLS
jgi:hypothetical protein